MAKVLVIGDLHCPAVHPEYMDFVKSIKKKYKTDTTVFIGDVVDHASISFHKKNPEHPAAMDEYHQTMDALGSWIRAFPTAHVTIGNHDERVARLAADAGIPPCYLKEYGVMYDSKNWNWQYSVEIDDVYYYHGVGAGGQYPAMNAAKLRLQSVVMGHYHSVAGINWVVGPTSRIFGMNVGSGVDRFHPAMQYGSAYLKKPVVSCAVVIDGHPYLELMDL
ncbi:MAG: metallophosphoesterase [Ignisphaera sp.]|jgi:predicted phosphodiesterase|nr:metallophosphoesterase [Ignisphaera sp.]